MTAHFRGCKEWQDYGLAFSTTSNEACKLYDAAVTQYVSWREDDSLGGIETTITNMLNADPEFVIGHVISNGLELMGTGRSVHLDPEFRASIDGLLKLADKSNITAREKSHVNAVKLWSDGQLYEACDVWEDILMQNPLDMLAVKFSQDAYFYLGLQPQMRDSVARVMPQWTEDMPLYCYLMGMYSFGLCETNLYQQAEKVARKGLEMNRHDAWSTHTLAHVMEMGGRQDEGIAFMSSTLTDWSVCGMLATHNFWHWAIYHIEKGEYEGALDIFDSEIGERCKSGAMLDIVDATSLLYRLELEGVNVGERWNNVFEICKPHVDDHILNFNDVHILMSCLGTKSKETTQKMMQSIRDFVGDYEGTNCQIANEVGLSICEAFVAYDEGDYSRSVNLLAPVRYKIVKIGGSNAQRDIFNLFLINAALKSPSVEHHKLARSLLAERKALKENAPMTDRLMAKALALHAD